MKGKQYKPVSPLDCNHPYRLNISGMQSASERYDVTVCPKCGEFRVTGLKDTVHFAVDFTLGTDESVHAAGQWVRYLDEETFICQQCGNERPITSRSPRYEDVCEFCEGDEDNYREMVKAMHSSDAEPMSACDECGAPDGHHEFGCAVAMKDEA